MKGKTLPLLLFTFNKSGSAKAVVNLTAGAAVMEWADRQYLQHLHCNVTADRRLLIEVTQCRGVISRSRHSANVTAETVLTTAEIVSTTAEIVSTTAEIVLTTAETVLTTAEIVSTTAETVLATAEIVSTTAETVSTTAETLQICDFFKKSQI